MAISDNGDATRIRVVNAYFKRCSNKTSRCKSDAEINQFLYDLRIRLFTWAQMMDFTTYDKNPVYLYQALSGVIYPAADSNNV